VGKTAILGAAKGKSRDGEKTHYSLQKKIGKEPILWRELLRQKLREEKMRSKRIKIFGGGGRQLRLSDRKRNVRKYNFL